MEGKQLRAHNLPFNLRLNLPFNILSGLVQAKLNIVDMCRDQWKWASANPFGYAGKETA